MVSEAVKAQLEAELKTAVANLGPYLDEARRVAIGEHPDHVLEARKLIEQAATAQGSLDFLARLSTEENRSCSLPLPLKETTRENPCPVPA